MMSRKRSREDAHLPEDPGEDLLLGTQETSLFELQVCEMRMIAILSGLALQSITAAASLLWMPLLGEGKLMFSGETMFD